MKLEATELSEAAIEGVGRLLTPSAGKGLQAGDEFSFGIVSPELGMPASLCAGRLECGARPMTLKRLERHLKTPEILSAVKGDSIICMAPAQEVRDGKLAGMRAILVREGQGVILDRGAWHWIPFPSRESATRFLVIFRAGTGDDDLDFCDLAENADIVSGAIELKGGAR